MNELGELLAYLYPAARPGTDYLVVQRSEAEGPVIAWWSVPGVPQPTTEYLRSKLPEYQALSSNWKQRREAKAAASGGKADLILLRAILRVIMLSIAQDRQYMASLRAELVTLGRTPPAAPAVRSWEQLVAAVQSTIDQGDGDPPAQPGGQTP